MWVTRWQRWSRFFIPSHKATAAAVTCSLSHIFFLLSELYCLHGSAEKIHLKNVAGDRKLAKTKCYVRQLKERQLGAFCVCFELFFYISALSVCQFCGSCHCIEFPPKTENCAITICAAQKCASSLVSWKKNNKNQKKTTKSKTETSCVAAFVGFVHLDK